MSVRASERWEITYLINDFGKSLLGQDLAAALIVLDVVRCRIQTRNINFSGINSNAERVVTVRFCATRDNACREPGTAATVNWERDSSQALKERRLSRGLSSHNDELSFVSTVKVQKS
jgi:hypothetical protein